MHNGLIKIITGIRRRGKSVLDAIIKSKVFDLENKKIINKSNYHQNHILLNIY